MNKSVRALGLQLVALALGLVAASAMVNPTLQPIGLYDRYDKVILLKASSFDMDKASVTLDVISVAKGEFPARHVVLTASGQAGTDGFHQFDLTGVNFTVYLGKRNDPNALLFYLGGTGRWQQGAMVTAGDAATPAQWSWTKDLDKEMFGCFNGDPARLVEMMLDKAKNRAFFPAVPFDLFKLDQVVGTFDQPPQGVALFDFNGDGRLDIYASSEGGGRLYLQQPDGTFADATKAAGLDGIKGHSVSVAYVKPTGRPDLLIDGKLYLQDDNGKFTRSSYLPDDADKDVLMAAFVDLNHDGYPDVIVSQKKGGLHAYLHPGAKLGPFIDATKSLGLDTVECGAGQTGFFTPGDWNNNGQTCLFYSVNPGLLLAQDAGGKFLPLPGVPGYDFNTIDQQSGLSGAGSFAPTWEPDSPDFVFAQNSGANILAKVEGKPFDAGAYGNEISIATNDCIGVATEDLNADGRIDVYAISRTPGTPNGYYVNRGYGSFISPLRYDAKAIPGPAHQQGALGIAIGDVNGDGANDILLAGTDGKLTLLINDTLSRRIPQETSTAQDKVLEQTGIVSVHVVGPRGVTGARVSVLASDGRTMAVRIIGSNVVTGCSGPDTVNIAIREPGDYKVAVRYSDGLIRNQNLTIRPREHTNLTINRN